MASESLTLEQAIAEYLTVLKPDQRRIAEPWLRKFVDYHRDMQYLSSLSPSRIELYAESQIKASDPAAPDRVQVLKAWFQYLKKKGHTTENYGIHIRARRPSGAARIAGGRGGTALGRPEDQSIEMTADGFEALKAELEVLENERLHLVRAVETARSDGDLRENAPYHAAREQLALASSRQRQVEDSLRRAVVVDRKDDDRSSVGSVVVVTNVDEDRRFEYKLVSAREANAAERKISVESPVGRELLGKRPGETVVVATPRGQVQFRIDAVRQG